MASSNGQSVFVFLLVAIHIVLYLDHSSGLSLKELVEGADPVIPEAVRLAENVTVKRSQTVGMYGLLSFMSGSLCHTLYKLHYVTF